MLLSRDCSLSLEEINSYTSCIFICCQRFSNFALKGWFWGSRATSKVTTPPKKATIPPIRTKPTIKPTTKKNKVFFKISCFLKIKKIEAIMKGLQILDLFSSSNCLCLQALNNIFFLRFMTTKRFSSAI